MTSQDKVVPPVDPDRSASKDEVTVQLHEEELSVSRRKVETSTVRVATVTRSHDCLVDEELVREHVEVEHVPIGRFVESAPPVREEGDLTILSVVEEVVVRRLLLREEVHIRRIRTTEHLLETVTLRKQEAIITRTPSDRQPDPTSPTNPHNLWRLTDDRRNHRCRL